MLSIATLFELSGSWVSLETVARSLMSCGSSAVTGTSIVTLSPAGSRPRSQSTWPARFCGLGVAVQLPFVVVTVPKSKLPLLTCASLTTTASADVGPRFSTVIVQIEVSPACIGWSGLQSLAMRRSASVAQPLIVSSVTWVPHWPPSVAGPTTPVALTATNSWKA